MSSEIERKINDILHILMNEFDYYYSPRCAECGSWEVFSDVEGGYYCENCGQRDDQKFEMILSKLKKNVSIERKKPELKIDGILTQEETAAAIGIAPNTLSARLKSGEIELPFIELTKGQRRFRKVDVERYIERLFEGL